MQVFERPGWEYFISIQFLSPDLGRSIHFGRPFSLRGGPGVAPKERGFSGRAIGRRGGEFVHEDPALAIS
jgi:hypothetical protein